MMLRKPAALALLSATVLIAAVLPAYGRARNSCDPATGVGAFDPIVYHGHAGPAGHRHTFFGNTKLLRLANPNAATYDDLAGADTSCTNPDQSSAYWIPTLQSRATGQPTPIHNEHVYYLSFDNDPHGAGRAIPPDLRMVAGDMHATGPQKDHKGRWIVSWGCGNGTTRPGPYASITRANCAAARPVDQARLQVMVSFPSCWSGALNPKNLRGNTADFHGGGAVLNQLAYHSVDCPPEFPIRLTKLRMVTIWEYRGDGSDVRLSSDHPGSEPGLGMHADFWQTWTPGALERVVAECVNTRSGPPDLCG